MEVSNRKLDSVTVSMNYIELNNLVIKMKNPVSKAKSFIIKKLSMKIETLKKKKKGTEVSTKNNNLIQRISEEIEEFKKLKKEHFIEVAKQALYCDIAFDKIAAKENAKQRCYARIGYHPEVQKHVMKFRKDHKDWKSLAAFLLSKNTGRRYKNKKIDSEFAKESIDNAESVFKSTRIQDKEFLTKDLIDTDTKDIDKNSKNQDSSNELNIPVDISTNHKMESNDKESQNDKSASQDDKSVAEEYDSMSEDDDSMSEDDISASEDDISASQDDISMSEDNISAAEHDTPVSNNKNINSEMLIEKFDMESLQSSNICEISNDKNLAQVNAPVAKKAKFKLQEEDFFMAGSSDEQSDDEIVEDSVAKVYQKKKEVSCKEARKNVCSSAFVGSLSKSRHIKHYDKNTSEQTDKLKKEKKIIDKSIPINKKEIKESKMDNVKSKTLEDIKKKQIKENKSKKNVVDKKDTNSTEILHPSWEASRKKKLENKDVKFAGTKISFDD